jgi:hypothetical protein
LGLGSGLTVVRPPCTAARAAAVTTTVITVGAVITDRAVGAVRAVHARVQQLARAAAVVAASPLLRAHAEGMHAEAVVQQPTWLGVGSGSGLGLGLGAGVVQQPAYGKA